MALAYMLKHSNGNGSLAVMGVCLGIIGSPILMQDETIQNLLKDFQEKPWIGAFGLGGVVVNYAYERYQESKE